MLKLRLAPFAAIGLTAAIAFAQESDVAPGSARPAAVKVAKAVKPTASAAAPAKPAASTPVVKAAPLTKTASIAKTTPVAKPASIAKTATVGKATPVPVATPVPKKQGFWARVFGKKPAPTPVPATPTPKPIKKKVVKKIRPQKPKIADATSTDTTPGSDKMEPGKSSEEATSPTKSEPVVKPPTPKSGRTKPVGEKVQNFPPSIDNAETEAAEKQKYDQAKAKAAADPKVKELRGKADTAPSEEESRKALRAYNKEMFKRMKEIDPSIKEHVDRMEDAVMKRLGE